MFIPLVCAGCLATAAAADRFEDVREHIRAGLVGQSVPSLAVAVARDGRILWEEGFGWADRERRIAATEHTVYSLASITKPITATGLMTLVQAGKVDLDSPANDYLGAVRLRARIGSVSEATVRRIANHTSGLPGHFQAFYADEPYARPSMDETILRYGNLVMPPAEGYRYSNLGYGVLGYIIERASGRSYAEFMRTEVFIPLGLTRTSVSVGPGFQLYTAMSYGLDGQPLPSYDVDHPGATAVFSSAHDLVRFGLFHLKAHSREQKAILTDASIDEMHRPTVRRDHKGRDRGYGIGFIVSARNGYRMVWHSGGMPGASTEMQLFPEERLAIVVLSNARSELPGSTADHIAGKLLPKWKLEDREREKSVPAPFATPRELLGTWKGTLATYAKETAVELRFTPCGEIHTKVGEQPRALVNEAQLKDGVLSGELNTRIDTPDTERYAYTAHLALTLRGDTLSGAIRAFSRRGDSGERYTLWHWMELRKTAVNVSVDSKPPSWHFPAPE